MVEVGNFYYFFFIAVFILLLIVAFFILRRFSSEKQNRILLIVSFLNLALHFGKLFFEPYRSDFPVSIRKVTFENICAVTTLLMPWVFLKWKQTRFGTYTFFIGIVGGLAALFFPTEAFHKDVWTFDVIRFYICHMTIAAVPILMGIFGLIRPKRRDFWIAPVFFLAIECLILVNEIVLIQIGFVDSDLAAFLDRDVRNSSFVFGPLSSFDKIAGILLIFVPKVFRQDVFLINGGIDFYWPVVWMIFPAFIYLPFVYELVILPFWIFDQRGRVKALKKSECIHSQR